MSKKILVVEDDKFLVKALQNKLIKSDFKVVVASNGKEGLKQVAKANPDLILLDIIMPVMDGISMLKELRKNNDTPVIILSNLSSEENVLEAIKAGTFNYLVKANYSLEDLVIKINEILDYRKKK